MTLKQAAKATAETRRPGEKRDKGTTFFSRHEEREVWLTSGSHPRAKGCDIPTASCFQEKASASPCLCGGRCCWVRFKLINMKRLLPLLLIVALLSLVIS